jgi:hypothetical protein
LTGDTTPAIHGLTRVGAGTASTDCCTGGLRRKDDQSDCAQGNDPKARQFPPTQHFGTVDVRKLAIFQEPSIS